MREYYFANVKVNMEDQIKVPDDWQKFQGEQPWETEIFLRSSKETPRIPEKDVKAFGGIFAAEREGRILFAERQGKIGLSKKLQEAGAILAAAKESEVAKEPETAKESETMKGSEMTKLQRKAEENQTEKPVFLARLSSGDEYRDNLLYGGKDQPADIRYVHNVIEALLPFHGGSIVHASCVKVRDQALLFCGPSGMGKSTQARLWETYRGTYMLSSDAPAVLLTPTGARAYGMPWDGSDHIITQESAPVAAVIRLRQGPENEIRPMDSSEAYQTLLAQGHLPMWDQEAMLLEMTVLKKLASAIPFYELSCRPDSGAVELAEQTVFG